MQASEWIAIGGVIVSLITLWILWMQMRKLNTQLMIQQFSDYTKRYQDIILHFPENINVQSFVLANCKTYDETMRYMRAYFDLCYEEWYLHTRKLIDKKIWGTWNSGIVTAMSKPAFSQAWAVIKKDTIYGGKFEQFIEGIVSCNSAKHARDGDAEKCCGSNQC